MHVVYFPASSTILAIVINPFLNKEISSSLLKNNFEKLAKQFPLNLHYVVVQISRGKHLGPAIGLIEFPNVVTIIASVRVLDDFPCISIPCNSRDNSYQILGWQVTAGKIGMQRCGASSQWFNERVLLSRYGHVKYYNEYMFGRVYRFFCFISLLKRLLRKLFV